MLAYSFVLVGTFEVWGLNIVWVVIVFCIVMGWLFNNYEGRNSVLIYRLCRSKLRNIYNITLICIANLDTKPVSTVSFK